jgi:hypothetical protein
MMDVIASLCAPLALRALDVFFRAKQTSPTIRETASLQKTSSFAEAQDKRSDILRIVVVRSAGGDIRTRGVISSTLMQKYVIGLEPLENGKPCSRRRLEQYIVNRNPSRIFACQY